MKLTLIQPFTVALVSVVAASLGSSLSGCDRNWLINHWIHSHEEDSAGTMVFRPVSYPFPLSRGREGWEIMESGRLVHHAIGAADAPAVERGTWYARGDVLSISLERPDRSLRFRIVHVDSTLLKLQPLPDLPIPPAQ
jgi:hypothetical protein